MTISSIINILSSLFAYAYNLLLIKTSYYSDYSEILFIVLECTRYSMLYCIYICLFLINYYSLSEFSIKIDFFYLLRLFYSSTSS